MKGDVEARQPALEINNTNIAKKLPIHDLNTHKEMRQKLTLQDLQNSLGPRGK